MGKAAFVDDSDLAASLAVFFVSLSQTAQYAGGQLTASDEPPSRTKVAVTECSLHIDVSQLACLSSYADSPSGPLSCRAITSTVTVWLSLMGLACSEGGTQHSVNPLELPRQTFCHSATTSLRHWLGGGGFCLPQLRLHASLGPCEGRAGEKAGGQSSAEAASCFHSRLGSLIPDLPW